MQAQVQPSAAPASRNAFFAKSTSGGSLTAAGSLFDHYTTTSADSWDQTGTGGNGNGNGIGSAPNSSGNLAGGVGASGTKRRGSHGHGHGAHKEENSHAIHKYVLPLFVCVMQFFCFNSVVVFGAFPDLYSLLQI